MKYSFILLSAGKGLRFGSAMPKQYLLLAGKPMIIHTLERLDRIDEIVEVIVVCNNEYVAVIKEYLKQYAIKKDVIFIEGGNSRQESVYNGLKKATHDNVIIHEAARPFVLEEDFKKLINCEEKNVSFTYSIPFTVLKKNGQGVLVETLNRDELVNIQLPQKFLKSDILECHELAIKENRIFTEDAGMLVYYTKKPVYCLEGRAYNIKITEHIDLLTGELIYKEEIRGNAL